MRFQNQPLLKYQVVFNLYPKSFHACVWQDHMYLCWNLGFVVALCTLFVFIELAFGSYTHTIDTPIWNY